MNNNQTTIEIADWSKLPKDPLVSVYMLTYRHEKFIAQAIEGVLAQKCDFSYELIIGEDCSPDATGKIVREYQQRYPSVIRVLTSEGNVGAYANARRCQKATRGKFIALCEGDDFWHHPQKLQMQVDLLVAHPEMTVCHTDFDRMTRFRLHCNAHRENPSPWLAKEDAYVLMLHQWTVMTATSMLPRWIFEEFWGSKYDNPDWPFGDHNRLLYASLKGTVGYIDVSTATYRKVRGSAGNRFPESHLRVQLADEECNLLFLKEHPVPAEIELEVRAILKSRIYRAAFFARRPDVMHDAYDWLLSRGVPMSLSRHYMRMAAIRMRLPMLLLLKWKNFIDLHVSSIQP